MAVSKIDDDTLLARLTEVFRLHGYEGASLAKISDATGLKRASLYHRFPGGKEQMAQAVLDRASHWFGSHILAPLSEPGEPAVRVREMARRLSEFYSHGDSSCLLDSLSIGNETHELAMHVREGLQAWIGAFAKISQDAGLPPAEAQRRAEEALVSIQGGLVLARALRDNTAFQRALADLPARLTTP